MRLSSSTATSAGALTRRLIVAEMPRLWRRAHMLQSRARNPAFSALSLTHRRCSTTIGPTGAALPPDLAPLPAVGQQATGIVVQGPQLSALERVKRLPLMLIEEIAPPPSVISEIELIMTAWSEEQAKHFLLLTMIVRFCMALCFVAAAYLLYRTWIATERRLRGVENMPRGLRIGSVVYLDIESEGEEVGRVVIGLLTENCPLYCEYFHRRCTGNGSKGESFRGLRLSALLPRAAAIFGDGRLMTHEVPGYNPNYLPTEWVPKGPWRGAISSIALGANKESPNFTIHMCGGDFPTQIFGMVLGGFDVIERMSRGGVRHGCNPNREFIVTGCGELCTLDKGNVQPLPWRLYETISNGYDEAFFGPSKPFPNIAEIKAAAAASKAGMTMDARDGGAKGKTVATGAAQQPTTPSNKPWWKVW